MCAALNGFWFRTRRRVCLGVWLALVCLAAGCEEMVSTPHTHDVGDLSRTDRIEVTFEERWNPAFAKFEGPPAEQTTDRQRIAKVAAFLGRYRDGWTTILSGSPGTRHLLFYDGDRLLTDIGVFGRGITDNSLVRLLTSAEVAELGDLLGTPWPAMEDTPSPAPRDKAR